MLKMGSKLRYIIKLFALSSVISLVIAIPLFWYLFQQYLQEPLSLEDDLLFTVPANSNLYAVTQELGLSGYLKYPRLLVWHARWKEQTNIQTGEYLFQVGATPLDLLEQLNNGKVVQHSITLIEGRTFRELLDSIHSDSRVSPTLAGKSDAEIVQALELEISHLEGWFYPDTYLFSRGTTDAMLLKRAHARMQDVLAEEWISRDVGLSFENSYEALILASIVEKETGVARERPEIAGVFSRRLQRGMRLQTDPTVIYGLGPEFDGNLTRRHLAKSTPYNTYRINGLPPTPIAAAGREAINAVLHPAAGSALYFVARGDGSHEFSDTLEQHNTAVRKYQIEQRATDYRSSPAE